MAIKNDGEPGMPPIAETRDVSLRSATAPPRSLWAEQKGADFFLPPALTIDTIAYLDLEPDPLPALLHRFGLRSANPEA